MFGRWEGIRKAHDGRAGKSRQSFHRRRMLETKLAGYRPDRRHSGSPITMFIQLNAGIDSQ